MACHNLYFLCMWPLAKCYRIALHYDNHSTTENLLQYKYNLIICKVVILTLYYRLLIVADTTPASNEVKQVYCYWFSSAFALQLNNLSDHMRFMLLRNF